MILSWMEWASSEPEITEKVVLLIDNFYISFDLLQIHWSEIIKSKLPIIILYYTASILEPSSYLKFFANFQSYKNIFK